MTSSPLLDSEAPIPAFLSVQRSWTTWTRTRNPIRDRGHTIRKCQPSMCLVVLQGSAVMPLDLCRTRRPPPVWVPIRLLLQSNSPLPALQHLAEIALLVTVILWSERSVSSQGLVHTLMHWRRGTWEVRLSGETLAHPPSTVQQEDSTMTSRPSVKKLRDPAHIPPPMRTTAEAMQLMHPLLQLPLACCTRLPIVLHRASMSRHIKGWPIGLPKVQPAQAPSRVARRGL
mmetsp:Transcript_35432/g.57332  ORF Transcript_35432/g.57332 Transcript_35432/m.57332 type:complete len:229 (-) Transcript_35432:710-1396(-)